MPWVKSEDDNLSKGEMSVCGGVIMVNEGGIAAVESVIVLLAKTEEEIQMAKDNILSNADPLPPPQQRDI